MLLLIIWVLSPFVGFIGGWAYDGVIGAISLMFVSWLISTIVLSSITPFIRYCLRRQPFHIRVINATPITRYSKDNYIKITPTNDGELVYMYRPRNEEIVYKTVKETEGNVVIRQDSERDSSLIEWEEYYSNKFIDFAVGPRNSGYIFYINEQQD